MKRAIIILFIIGLYAFDSLNNNNICIMIIPLVPIIAGGVSVASSIFGSSKAAKAARENEKILKGLQDENKANYIEEYYRGSLDNPGAQTFLKRLDENLRDKTTATENNAAATGATQENVLAAKQSNNEVYSNAVGDLVQNEDARKQGVKQNYFTNKTNLLGQQMSLNSQKAANWQNIASGISQAAGNLASSYLMSGGGKVLSGGAPSSYLPSVSAPASVNAVNAAPATTPAPTIKKTW